MKPQAHSVTQIFILKMNWSIPWILPWRQYQPLNHNYYLPHWLRPSQHFSYLQDIWHSFISSTSPFTVNFNRLCDVWPHFKGSPLVHGVCGHLGSHPQSSVLSLTPEPACCFSWACSISCWGCCSTTTWLVAWGQSWSHQEKPHLVHISSTQDRSLSQNKRGPQLTQVISWLVWVSSTIEGFFWKLLSLSCSCPAVLCFLSGFKPQKHANT